MVMIGAVRQPYGRLCRWRWSLRSSAGIAPQLNGRSGPLSEDLRRVLRGELLKGPCTVSAIARLFCLHPRTFSRHLADEGAAFQRVVDEIRFDIACDLLANTGMPISQVATVLKYSEASAFTRAFHRWSGQSPSGWRANHLRTRKKAGRRARRPR